MLRLLLWIYTGHVENASHRAIVDDLVAADRFQLLEMKRTEIMKNLTDLENSIYFTNFGFALNMPQKDYAKA